MSGHKEVFEKLVHDLSEALRREIEAKIKVEEARKVSGAFESLRESAEYELMAFVYPEEESNNDNDMG